MNEVNALWVSPWRELQKNLASSFVQKAPAKRRLSGESPAETPAATPWLLRAQASEYASYG